MASILRPPCQVRFLGRSIAGIEPAWETPFPWLNHPEPLSFEQACAAESKMIFVDGGLINFSIDAAGEMHWVLQLRQCARTIERHARQRKSGGKLEADIIKSPCRGRKHGQPNPCYRAEANSLPPPPT